MFLLLKTELLGEACRLENLLLGKGTGLLTLLLLLTTSKFLILSDRLFDYVFSLIEEPFAGSYIDSNEPVVKTLTRPSATIVLCLSTLGVDCCIDDKVSLRSLTDWRFFGLIDPIEMMLWLFLLW